MRLCRRRRAAGDPTWGAATVLLAAGLGLGACRAQPPPAPDVVARIDAADVPYSELKTFLDKSLGEPADSLSSDVLSELFDQFLDETLLSRLAVDEKAAAPGTDRRKAIDGLLAKNLPSEPTAEEVAGYYAAHRAEFERPERVHLRQILVEDRTSAESAVAALKRGEDFAAVARRLSRDPSASYGGDQGELARSDLPTAFADVIFGLKPGEASDIVPAEYGFHIFQVVEHLQAELQPLAAAEPEIRLELRRAAGDQALARLVVEARARYTVKVFGRNLPFNYRGAYGEHEAAK